VLISGAAGSLKSTAGLLLLLGIQQVLTPQGCALVIVNTKGEDFLYADLARERWENYLPLRKLTERDRRIYATLGYTEPPALQQATVFVPDASDPTWRSSRPSAFPRTRTYQLSHASGLRYALSPTEDDERPATVVTRQCMEEASGPFARERNLTDLPSLAAALEAEFVALSGERQRWRNQFQALSVGATVRQFRTAARDLGPLLATAGSEVALPVADLATGGTWIIDVAPLGQRAAQAVLDEVVQTLWQAKAHGVIPHTLPLVLMVDELNRWSATGPTAARLAAIARDQRHRRFSVVGLAQQLGTLHPGLLANADTVWYGITRSRELAEDVYNHLPEHVRAQLHRLPPGQRLLDAWPRAEPIRVSLPWPSWLTDDEGRMVVERWHTQKASALPGER
jgi:hypothetical protein